MTRSATDTTLTPDQQKVADDLALAGRLTGLPSGAVGSHRVAESVAPQGFLAIRFAPMVPGSTV